MPAQPAVMQPAEVFSPEFYILKKPSDGDMTRLQSFLASKNEQTRASAGLIIGYYFLRDGDMQNAALYLEQYADDAALTPYMKQMVRLWQMELSLAKEDLNGAREFASLVQDDSSSEGGVSALDTYCVTMHLYPSREQGPYGCVISRLSSYHDDTVEEVPAEPGTTASLWPDDMPDAFDILVVGTGDMQDISGGVYFYAQKNGANHKIRLSRTYIEGDWDFVMDIDKGYLGGRGYGIYFSPDVSSLLASVDGYIDLNCGNILLGVGRSLRPSGELLKNKLEEQGNVVEVTSIDDAASVVRQMRTVLARWEQQPFCAVGAGTEAEINNFVPNVRQYITKPNIQYIYFIQDIESGGHRSGNYRNYYTNAIELPMIDLYMDEDLDALKAEYNDFSGRDLNYISAMGYDMMHYIMTQSFNPTELADPYITDIIGMDNGKVIRSVRGYLIDAEGHGAPVELREPPVEEPGVDELIEAPLEEPVVEVEL